jgi:hypothetical protein
VNEVEASSATFSNITVTNIASFSATLVEASSVIADSATFQDITVSGSATFGGSTINEIAQAELANVMVSEVRALASASNDKIATELAVRNALDSVALFWVDASG